MDDLLDRMSALLREAGREYQAGGPGPGREGYLLALAKRLSKREALVALESTTELEQWRILSALMVRFDQVAASLTAPENEGRPHATRAGHPARRRPFDAPLPPASRVENEAAPLPACLKPAVLTEDDGDPF